MTTVAMILGWAFIGCVLLGIIGMVVFAWLGDRLGYRRPPDAEARHQASYQTSVTWAQKIIADAQDAAQLAEIKERGT